MNLRTLRKTGILLLAATVISGCSKAAAPDTAPAQETAPEAESTADTPSVTEVNETEEETLDNPETVSDDQVSSNTIANPWRECTEDEAMAACARLFSLPDGAGDVNWSIMEAGESDPELSYGLVQATFTLADYEDILFTARAQQGTEENEDISGLYYDWTVSDNAILANWGDDNMEAQSFRYIGDDETIDLITWYDTEIGISYSLSATAPDLDGFDIQAIAESMYDPEKDQYASGPSDFLQYQSGVMDFKDYDQVISYLKPGQGYAYVNVYGSDEKLLLVAETVFEADHSTNEASAYIMKDGSAKQLTCLIGNGSAYPLRIDSEGIIYCGDNHTYETYVVSEDDSLIVKEYISDGINDGSNEISGFVREGNDMNSDKDYTGTKEDFEKLISDSCNQPAIEFTVVE